MKVYVQVLKENIFGVFQVNEECSTLRLSLSDAQHECEVAKGEVSALHVKVQNLETVVKVTNKSFFFFLINIFLTKKLLSFY